MQRSFLLPIRQSLLNSFPVEEVKRKIKKDPSKSAVEAHKARGNNVLSDETILSVRRSKEVDNMRRSENMKMHGITEDQYHSIVNYRSRAHLVPDFQH